MSLPHGLRGASCFCVSPILSPVARGRPPLSMARALSSNCAAQASGSRSALRMSVSTPEPPSAPRKPSADRPEPMPGAPRELVSVEMFEAALRANEARTYISVDAGGVVRERPFLVVVEAYSKSCRACIGMRRAFSRCAEEHLADAAFYMFDSDAVPRLSQMLGIRSLPTFVLFKRGARIDHFNASARETLEENIRDNL